MQSFFGGWGGGGKKGVLLETDTCRGNRIKVCRSKQSHSAIRRNTHPVPSATQKWPHLKRFQLKIDVLITRYFFRQKNCSIYFF